MTESPTLDAEQTAAASRAPESRQIVLAPPGSGKTEVVAALLEHLVDEGLDSFGDLLAISFSRAAVGALERRIGRERGTRAAIRTLDSLASRILDEGDDPEWRTLSFDDRIARAVALVEAGSDFAELTDVRHLIVDEVQDLVGVRARLVLAFLANLPSDVGFTLLGDPHQGVYDFQLEGQDDMTSKQFLDHVRQLGALKEVRLSGQYRARSQETRAAAATLQHVEMGAERIRTLRSFVCDIFLAGDIAELARPAKRWTGTTAFLCRTNGQAMVVAEQLRASGLAVTTRGPADALPLASWIAETFSGLSSRVLAKDDALALLADGAPPMSATSAWRLLKDAERDFRSPDRLDLRRLGGGLARGLGSADLYAGPGTDAIVSTIHRAKGLEFDNVVLVNPSDLLTGTATDEDASVAYVAITRGRDVLMAARCTAPDFLRVDKRSGRWFIGGYKPWMTRGFELRGTDSRTPAIAAFDEPATQYVGRAVVGRVDMSESTLDVPVYSLFCGNTLVATTTEDFGRILATRLGGASRTGKPWPSLTGLAVESVETLVPMSAVDSTPTFQLGLRVAGLAMLHWGDEESR
ncbi:UvrD-helicase domain-containing protein [Microvirga sp. 0TCS3.31]